MAAVGSLEFDGIKVELKKYEKFISRFKPKGKDKGVTVQMINYGPMQVAGQATKGMVKQFGGTVGKMPQEMIQFPVEFNSKGEPTEYKEGTLHYFEQKTPAQNSVAAPSYKPSRIKFVSGKLRIDGNNDALILFSVVSGRNKMNSARIEELSLKEIGWSRIPAVWEVLEPLAAAAKSAAKLNTKEDAFKRVRLALTSNQVLAKQLYESQNMTDWDSYVTWNVKEKCWKGDFSQIENVLLTLADTEPQKVINLLNDTALDIRSKVVLAVNQGILLQEGNSWLWGGNADGGKYKNVPAADKLITKIPTGKGATSEAVLEWFCDFLKGEPELMTEINKELDEAKLAQG